LNQYQQPIGFALVKCIAYKKWKSSAAVINTHILPLLPFDFIAAVMKLIIACGAPTRKVSPNVWVRADVPLSHLLCNFTFLSQWRIAGRGADDFILPHHAGDLLEIALTLSSKNVFLLRYRN
jgi:hypothetical protein